MFESSHEKANAIRMATVALNVCGFSFFAIFAFFFFFYYFFFFFTIQQKNVPVKKKSGKKVLFKSAILGQAVIVIECH